MVVDQEKNLKDVWKTISKMCNPGLEQGVHTSLSFSESLYPQKTVSHKCTNS